MSRSFFLLRGIFYVAVALYPFLVYFGLKYVPPGTLGLILAIFLAFRFGILSSEEKSVLLPMMLLLVAFALLAAVMESSRMLLVYPVLVNLFLAITFARSLRGGDSILLMAVKARKIEIGEYVPPYLYRLSQVWVLFFLLNGTVAAWTCTQSLEVWAIYNGLISYIAAGCLLAGEFVFRIYYRKKMGIASTRSQTTGIDDKNRSGPLLDRLESGPWVDSACLAADDAGVVLEIALTPEGHYWLRDNGLEACLESLQEQIPPEERAARNVRFRSLQRLSQLEEVFKDTRTFPRLLSTLVEPDCYRLLVQVDTDLDWFRGHFPGTPVLPGVVQLHWAARVACSLFGIDAPPGTVNRLKFQNIVVPPRVIELEIKLPDRGRVAFSFRSLDVTHASGVLRFDEPGSC